MEFIRTLLFALVIFLSYTLYESWNKTNTSIDANNSVISQSVDGSSNHKKVESDVPSIKENVYNNQLESKTHEVKDYINIKTNLLDLSIDKSGGNIVGAKLLKYNKTLKSKESLDLLNDSNKDLYIAPNGLTSKYGPDSPDSRAYFFSNKDSYDFQSSINHESSVDLIWVNKDKNLKVIKTFEFSKDSYVINVKYKIINNMVNDWEGHVFSVLKQKYNPQASSGFMGFTPFQGVAFYDQSQSYQKLAFSNIESSKNKEWVSDAGWMAMIQHYFLSAWIPPKSEKFNYKVGSLGNDLYSITMLDLKMLILYLLLLQV